MRAEFYIAQLIRWNPRLREHICNWLGVFPHTDEPEGLLSELRGEFELLSKSQRLNCQPQNVFLVLRNRILKLLGTDAGVLSFPQLRRDDLTLFFNDVFLEQIANGLDCPAQWTSIVQRLFNVKRLEDLCRRAGIVDPHEPLPADKLFWRMVSRDSLHRLFHFFGGPSDIWSILTSLLDEEAKSNLCKHFNCLPEEIFGAVFVKANLLEASGGETESITDESQKLDSLAVTKLQEVLRTIAYSYLRWSKEIAERFWESTSDLSTTGTLLPLLNFHGEQAYRRALQQAIRPKQSIGSLALTVEQLSPQTFEPDIQLKASIKQEKEDKHVFVEFKRGSESKWNSLLSLHGPDTNILKHVVKHIPQTVAELNGSGATVVQHVLTAEIAASETLERRLWSLLEKHDNALTNAFVLRPRKLPDELQIAQIFESNVQKLSIASLDSKTVCPTPKEVHDRITREYMRYGVE